MLESMTDVRSSHCEFFTKCVCVVVEGGMEQVCNKETDKESDKQSEMIQKMIPKPHLEN